MTRRMLNLLHSITYDWNVSCKELAPAVSASVRNVENAYYFFFFFGWGNSKSLALDGGLLLNLLWRVVNGGPPSLCRRAVCAARRRRTFDRQAACSVLLACSAKALPRVHMSKMCVWDWPVAVPGLGSELVFGETRRRDGHSCLWSCRRMAWLRGELCVGLHPL